MSFRDTFTYFSETKSWFFAFPSSPIIDLLLFLFLPEKPFLGFSFIYFFLWSFCEVEAKARQWQWPWRTSLNSTLALQFGLFRFMCKTRLDHLEFELLGLVQVLVFLLILHFFDLINYCGLCLSTLFTIFTESESFIKFLIIDCLRFLYV